MTTGTLPGWEDIHRGEITAELYCIRDDNQVNLLHFTISLLLRTMGSKGLLSIIDIP